MGLQRLISTYIPQGVFVITSHADNKINGMTAAWVSQVSFKPTLLSLAIAPQRYTYELIKESGIFCINVLGKEHLELAKHFGFQTGRKANKFEGIRYKTALNGSPVLIDAIAYFECRVIEEFKAGDHMILIGEVVDYQAFKEEEPLIFKWEDFFGGIED